VYNVDGRPTVKIVQHYRQSTVISCFKRVLGLFQSAPKCAWNCIDVCLKCKISLAAGSLRPRSWPGAGQLAARVMLTETRVSNIWHFIVQCGLCTLHALTSFVSCQRRWAIVYSRYNSRPDAGNVSTILSAAQQQQLASSR